MTNGIIRSLTVILALLGLPDALFDLLPGRVATAVLGRCHRQHARHDNEDLHDESLAGTSQLSHLTQYLYHVIK